MKMCGYTSLRNLSVLIMVRIPKLYIFSKKNSSQSV